MKNLLKSTLKPVLNVLYRYHMRSGREVKIDGIRFWVDAGIFHPGLFFSSKLLNRALLQNSLTQKKVLDVGSGSGVLSVFAAKQDAIVTALDISESAVLNTLKNAESNEVRLEAIQSDLWEQLPMQSFDFIVINPPFYPKNPDEEAQYAWYCGENFEYFIRFFAGLENYVHERTKVLMVLSKDCDIAQISLLAQHSGFVLREKQKRTNFWETNYIFEIDMSSTN